jgi:hypothetical protein
LNLGEFAGACTALSAGRPRIALPRGFRPNINQKQKSSCILPSYLRLLQHTRLFPITHPPTLSHIGITHESIRITGDLEDGDDDDGGGGGGGAKETFNGSGSFATWSYCTMEGRDYPLSPLSKITRSTHSMRASAGVNPHRSAMVRSRPGVTTFVIMVNTAPSKFIRFLTLVTTF